MKESTLVVVKGRVCKRVEKENGEVVLLQSKNKYRMTVSFLESLDDKLKRKDRKWGGKEPLVNNAPCPIC